MNLKIRRLSYIIQVGPKASHEPFKAEKFLQLESEERWIEEEDKEKEEKVGRSGRVEA